jgi:putative nucleotidyltransferase with HDIG domain
VASLWESIKSGISLSDNDETVQLPEKEHQPFNIDLSTRSGVEASQQLPTLSDMQRIKTYQQAADKLPMPPVLWDEFQRASNRGASNQKIADIIKSDPTLAALILKIANSPGFGLRTEITDVGRGISHLGHSLVKGVVAKHCFAFNFSQKNKTYNVEQLWKHSIAVSALTEIVGRHIPRCNVDLAGTIGLFHDIGRMGFNAFAKDVQPAMFDPDVGYLTYEAVRFGCTHLEMGEIFARHWQLPEKIQLGIKYHHHPEFAEASAVPELIRAEVLAVSLADTLAKHLEFAGGNNGKTLPHESYAALLPKTTLYNIMHEQAVSKELWRVNTIEF